MDETLPFDSGDRSQARDAKPELFPAGKLLFDRYRVERELGAGGMGVVLLAKDEKLGKPVAVKLVRELDAKAVEDLRREVLRGMELTHPGIVRTYYFEHEGNLAAIVMEYIQGKTLAALMALEANDCFNCSHIVPWVVQLCEVLRYAHGQAKIVHRDLKPRNVMVTKSGQIKVADFGISASISESLTRHTIRVDTSGTPPYMSPQQVDGLPATTLDDIYSFGAVIYELLTGKPPFFRGNALAICSQVREVVPPTMAARREDLGVKDKLPIPMVWEDIVARCLSKDPADRPQTMDAILQELEASGALYVMEQNRPQPSGTTSKMAVPTPPSGNSGVAWGLIGATVVLAGAAGAYFALSSRSDTGGTAKVVATPTPVAVGVVKPTPVKPDPATEIFENSLGMKFVTVPGIPARFAINHTRQRDFTAFAQTHPEWTSDPLKSRWRNPLYRDSVAIGSGADAPVVMVSWQDAEAFCQWLSATESKSGKTVTYRLPTRDEWHAAWGTGDYPWGSAWPPPRVNGKLPGNYADRSARTKFGSNFPVIAEYDDGFPALAPVGTFAPNRLGLHDLGSNVQEWSSDEGAGHRKLALGASWVSADKDLLRWKAVSEEVALAPDSAWPFVGFRCVVELSGR